MVVGDIDEGEHTWTRSELLRARGWDGPDFSDQVGSDPNLIEEVPAPKKEAPAAEHDGEHRCAGCGASLAGRQATARWCSAKCKERVKREASRQAGPSLELDSDKPAPKAEIPINLAVLAEQPRPKDLLSALAGCGFRLELVGPTGQRWKLEA